MPEVTKIEVITYQRDVKEWHCAVFDISDKHSRKLLGETTKATRSDAEQYGKDMEDYYLCNLEVANG